MPSIVDVIGSYRATFTTGAVTALGAGSAVNGHLLAMRWASAGKAARILGLDVDFFLTTAFTAAQEVGFEAHVVRAYTVPHSGATALAFGTNDGKLRSGAAGHPTSSMTGRIASTTAITAGTQTFDGNAIARGGGWASAVGARIGPQRCDFTTFGEPGGLLLQNEEGLVVRNTIAMGAAGAGKWHFTLEWEEVLLV